MILSVVSLLPFAALLANAFIDASPFFFASTSEILSASSQIESAPSLVSSLSSSLKDCPSDFYIISSQLGVRTSDFAPRSSVQHLRSRIDGEDESVKSSFEIVNVVGEVNTHEIEDFLKTACHADVLNLDYSTGQVSILEGQKPLIIHIDFPTLPIDSTRSQTLSENDAFLASVVDNLPSSSYSLMYITTPDSVEKATPHDEVESQTAYHDDLRKRQDATTNSYSIALPSGPLFAKYQYFTPGLFMGLFVTVIVLTILYIAITAISSLKVSYMAFDKEMGPSAQKKKEQQQ